MDIRQLIRAKGLKQNWIANQIGIPAPRFSLMMTGQKPVPDDVARKLATTLGLSRRQIETAISELPLTSQEPT